MLRAAHYDEAVNRLVSDPIVIGMAESLPHDLSEFYHLDEEGSGSPTPRHDFMMAANHTYTERGGTNHAHLGAVAEALYVLKALVWLKFVEALEATE